MQRGWDTQRRLFTLLLGLFAAAFVLSIITAPDEALQASLGGLRLWWDWVFPALLPYMIVAEMMFGLGVPHALGVLLEPVMKKLFRLPGAGGRALAAGLIGGGPIGAETALRLSGDQETGSSSVARLASLCHLCNPMLVIGVVGAGFLHSPRAGFMLALVHYGAAAVAAILLGRIHSVRPTDRPSLSSRRKAPGKEKNLALRALRAMENGRKEDGRAFGKLLGDAVSQSIQSLMITGGMIMMFSVAIRLALLQLNAGPGSGWLLVLVSGVLEPHLGAFSASGLQGLPPSMQAAAVSAILAWSGFSLHIQAAGPMKQANIRYTPFLCFRALHAVTAALLALAAWKPLAKLLTGAEAAFSPVADLDITPGAYTGNWSLRELGILWSHVVSFLALSFSAILIIALAIRVLERTTPRRPRP